MLLARANWPGEQAIQPLVARSRLWPLGHDAHAWLSHPVYIAVPRKATLALLWTPRVKIHEVSDTRTGYEYSKCLIIATKLQALKHVEGDTRTRTRTRTANYPDHPFSPPSSIGILVYTHVVPSEPQCFLVARRELVPHEGVVFPKRLSHRRDFRNFPREKILRVLERGGADEYTAHAHHPCVRKTK